jgi:hypothetical protein
MDTVRHILRLAGFDGVEAMEVNDPLTLSVSEVMDLTVEKVGKNRLSVAHYWERRGDLMRDPEIVFAVENGWTPIRYRQDPRFALADENGLDIEDFVSQWDNNLRRQGFIAAARDRYDDKT